MSRTPREVYDDHVAALASLDVDAVAADYSPDAVLASNGGIGRGRDHVRAVFAAFLAEPTQIVPTVEIHELGDTVFVTWTASSGAGAVAGADTFVVRDGLIVVHTGFLTGSLPDWRDGPPSTTPERGSSTPRTLEPRCLASGSGDAADRDHA